MRTVNNPKKLFRKVEATDMLDGGEGSFEFNVGEENGGQLAVRKATVEFENLEDPADDFHAALETIEEAAAEVDSTNNDDVPDGVDTQFTSQENGDTVIYMADTDRMGYEVIRQVEPRLAGYVVLFPDAIVKVRSEQ